MRSPVIFIFTILLISAAVSAVIIYGSDYVPALANDALGNGTKNSIALSAVTLPVIGLGLLLWWRK
ncbi:hypothetical protein Pse7367_0800 [Thalassoporum mexicanum PCC 7367]|uniref:hypothetical protein n=1 Tax=Thalassoporum mexicanum TaxID=3457544 RepID=UPI00029FD673|nr:hypothetical protein [Pseudanabaena sp. PCC 7367]AFY69100.1 hypothetical protein Pse7367_0800 [Pseudanabaena sp. PCC 7367]